MTLPMARIADAKSRGVNTDPQAPRVRLIRAATGGFWQDRQEALKRGSLLLPPPPFETPEALVLDLGSDQFEILALQNLVLAVAERVRSGLYGPVRLIIATRDPGVALFVDHLAGRLALGLYIAAGTSADAVRNARPAGNLTATEQVTLDAILASDIGGMTASALAERFGIELTAAGNRLVNLEKRGLVYRLRQPGREPDRYVDPRAALLGPTSSPTP